MVQGHVGDVPMHRLSTQLGDTLLFARDIRRRSPEFRRRNFGGGGGGTTFHTLDIRKYWDSDQILTREMLGITCRMVPSGLEECYR